MHKSSHFDISISYVMNYVISKYSPSLESCNLVVLLYVSFYKNKVKQLIYRTKIVQSTLYPIKNYSGVSVEFRQIKAAMDAPKQQMLPSYWSDKSTAITGDFKHLIVCDFPAGLASEFSSESPKKIKIVVQYLIIPWPRQIALPSILQIYIYLLRYIHMH